MPVFPKPRVQFSYDVGAEIKALIAHRVVRNVPKKEKDTLLVGSWNVANLGAQLRRGDDLRLIAEILSWFDIAAVQECRDNFGDLEDIMHYLADGYGYVMSDASGNNERMVFLCDRKKLRLLEEIGEISFPPKEAARVAIPGVKAKFAGFDRTPYLASFVLNDKMSVLLINVHLFYGSEAKPDIQRRALETAAVARWAAVRRKSRYSFAREVVALGDFNMPKPDKHGGNVVYDALTSRGLVTPEHSAEIGSSIASDNHYDQVAIFPETSKNCFVDMGVYDYDTVIFRELWNRGTSAADRNTFMGYLRYYMSDHRPVWFRMRMR